MHVRLRIAHEIIAFLSVTDMYRHTYIETIAEMRCRISCLPLRHSAIKKILIALHVGREDDGTTCLSNSLTQGNHWSLLTIDVESKSAYDGDSLGWPVPYNLMSALKEDLDMFECHLGIDP